MLNNQEQKRRRYHDQEALHEQPVMCAFLTYSNQSEAAFCMQKMNQVVDCSVSPTFIKAWHLYYKPPHRNKTYMHMQVWYMFCMYFCMYVHLYVFLAPNSIFCSMAFHRLAHHDGALPWGQCGICGTSLRPPFHGLRDPPWPNLTVYEWVQVWWLDSSEGWRWVCEWQWLPCHASCVMAPRAGGAWAGGQPMHTFSEDCFL